MTLVSGIANDESLVPDGFSEVDFENKQFGGHRRVGHEWHGAYLEDPIAWMQLVIDGQPEVRLAAATTMVDEHAEPSASEEAFAGGLFYLIVAGLDL